MFSVGNDFDVLCFLTFVDEAGGKEGCLPYEQITSGELVIHGVPDCLMPLRKLNFYTRPMLRQMLAVKDNINFEFAPAVAS
jgi:hypothetical protein